MQRQYWILRTLEKINKDIVIKKPIKEMELSS